MAATLKITERDSTSFKGEFTFAQNNVNAVAGTISDGKINWRTTKVLQGALNQPTTGTLKDNTINAKFKLVTRSGKKTYTATGTIKLSSAAWVMQQSHKENKKADAAEAPAKEILKIEGRLTKDDPRDKKLCAARARDTPSNSRAGKRCRINLRAGLRLLPAPSRIRQAASWRRTTTAATQMI